MTQRHNTRAQRLKGQAFSPGSSAAIGAEIHLQTHAVFLTDPENQQVLTRASLETLKLDMPIGSGPCNVHFPDHWLFQATDPRLPRLLNEPLGSQTLRRLEQFHPRLIIITLLAMIGIIGLWKWFVPILVSVAVWMTPEPVVQQIDRATLSSLDLLIAEETELPAEVQASNRAILGQLLPHARDIEARSIKLEFRQMPGFGPNAFALPGGTLVLTDELVQRFGDNPDLIAGVLAHEIGHVAENHSLHQLYQSLSLYVLIALIAGDVGPILEDLAFEGQTLANLSFSRKHEMAADTYALHLLADSGYSSDGIRYFFEVLSVDDSGPSWTSSHPSSAERLDNIDSFQSIPDLPDVSIPSIRFSR